jgi:FkbM family methyltransferase
LLQRINLLKDNSVLIKLKEKLCKMLTAFDTPLQVFNIFLWPMFSLSSYLVISSLIRQGIRPATIIDVGANVGQFAVASAKLLKPARIVSFEPDPHTAELFKRNTAAITTIELIQKALGEKKESAEFFVNKESQVSSILALSSARLAEFPDHTVKHSIPVEIDTLDDIFESADLQRPILLKIDVQGYEDRVLAGASTLLKSVDFVILEISFKPLYEGEKSSNEMIHLMEQHGFIFLRPLNWNISPQNGEIIEIDALFSRISGEMHA